MINPTQADIGRGVLYVPTIGPHEAGEITSFNERYVFVRYDGDVHSKATERASLEWAHVEIDPLERMEARAATPR